jgi:acyl-CoA thioester hydrolase
MTVAQDDGSLMNDQNSPNLKDRAPYRCWTTDIIRYRDLDPNGHVNNGAINEYFEDGRVRFREQNLVVLSSSILTGFVLAKFSVEYYVPLHYPGEVEIGTSVLRIGRTSYTLGQGIFTGDRCAAAAEVVTVYVDPETGKATPLSDELRSILEKFQALPS